MRGKIRTFELCPKLLEQPDAEAIQQAFGYFNRIQYSRNGMFKHRHGKTKKWIDQGMHLHRLSVCAILRKNIPEALLRYVLEVNGKPVGNYDRLQEMRRSMYPHKLTFLYKDRVKMVVEDYWVTHQKVCQPEVDRELDVITELIDQHQWSDVVDSSWGMHLNDGIKSSKDADGGDLLRVTLHDELLEVQWCDGETTKGEAKASPFFMLLSWFSKRLLQVERGSEGETLRVDSLEPAILVNYQLVTQLTLFFRNFFAERSAA